MKLKKIKIPQDFTNTPPKPWKIRQKYEYYIRNGTFESDIVVDRHYNLLNGYTSYLIAKMFGIKDVEVTINN